MASRAVFGEQLRADGPLAHLLLVALIPAVCCYYATVFVGWQIGTGDPLHLTSDSALTMALAMYGALLAGVFAKEFLERFEHGDLINWLRKERGPV